MAAKKPKATTIKKDYFKLPFDIKYENLEVTSYELLYNEDDGKPKRFSDFVALRQETGRSYGVTFSCNSNSGGELRACILGQLDEVTLDMFTKRSRWIRSILEKFPKDKKLKLDPGTD